MDNTNTILPLNTPIELSVTGEICMSSKYYYITHLPDNDTDYYIPQYPYQHHTPLPSTCHCIIRGINSGVPYIEQDKAKLLNTLYQKNKVYPFKIISQTVDPNTKKSYLMLADKYQFSYRLYLSDHDMNNSQQLFLPDKEINCAVRRIDPRGFLILGLDGSTNSLKIFITAERLFAEIGAPEDVEPYFFRMREIMEQDIFIHKPFHSLFKEYEMSQNLWIFSYLKFLGEYIDLLSAQWKNKQYETLEKLVDLFCKIELWIVEGSNFLENFSLDKALEIRQVADEHIAKMRRIAAAIGLIKKGQAKSYIARLLQKAERSSYIRNTNVHIQILVRLFIFSPSILIRNRSKMLKLLSILIPEKGLQPATIKFLANLLETYLRILDKKKRHPHVQLLLNACLLLCYQELDDSISFAVKKSRLFRCIGKMNRKLNLRRSIECLLNHNLSGLDAGFEWKDLIGLQFIDLPLIDKTKQDTTEILQARRIITDTNGQIVFTPHRIAIYPPQNELKEVPYLLTTERTTFLRLMQKQLVVALPSDVPLDDMPFSRQNKIWMDAQAKNKPDEPASKRQLLQVTIQQPSKKAAIATIGKEKKNARISPVNISKWYIPNLSPEDIFEPGDSFIAEIISDAVCPDLSIRNLSWDIAREIYHPDDTVNALCLSKDELGNYYWITEHGLYGYSTPSYYMPRLNSVYKTSVKGHSTSMQAVVLEVLNLVPDESYKPETLIRNFVKQFLTPAPEAMETVATLTECRHLAKELLNILLDEIEQEQNEQQRFNLLQAGMLIANVTKNNLLIYFSAELSYMINIDKFRISDYKDIRIPLQIRQKTTPFYQEIILKREICTLLSYFLVDNEPIINLLYDKINDEKDSLTGKLAGLVLTANLLKRSNITEESILTPIKEKILTLLNASTVPARLPQKQAPAPKQEEAAPAPPKIAYTYHETIPVDFGVESTTREFKTSIVYPPGLQGADMPKQMDIILRTISSFLNSKGGTLLIGIQNDGTPKGIQADLSYLNGDEDLYERIIRQHIVEKLSKDINSLIEFQFRHYNKNTICEIAIPAYERPVFYKKRLWQRQGNECRVIRKSDMADYWKRRFPKQEITEEDIAMVEDEVLFHVVITEDKRCKLTSKKPNEQEKQTVFPVYDYCKDGFLLLGYENGRFNKIPVMHLQKEVEKGDIYFENNRNEQPMFLSVIPRHLLLATYARKEEEEFVKIYDTANIPARTNPTGKGQLIVGRGELHISDIKLIDYEHRNRLSSLFYLSTNPPGVSLQDEKCKEAIQYASRIKCITEVLRLK